MPKDKASPPRPAPTQARDKIKATKPKKGNGFRPGGSSSGGY